MVAVSWPPPDGPPFPAIAGAANASATIATSMVVRMLRLLQLISGAYGRHPAGTPSCCQNRRSDTLIGTKQRTRDPRTSDGPGPASLPTGTEHVDHRSGRLRATRTTRPGAGSFATKTE